MSYATVRGGEAAVRAAEALERSRAEGSGLSAEAISKGLRYAVDAAASDAGLWAPPLAALAFLEAQGDPAEAAFLLRAYRSTLPRFGNTLPLSTDPMRLVRRVSSAFKDVPGGQVLGATRDYSRRLLGSRREGSPPPNGGAGSGGDGRLTRVTDLLREAGLVAGRGRADADGEPSDLTREALKIPATRSARLQALSRGETGAMGALAYSSLRGFGASHATLAEFRVGYLPLEIEHPYSGEVVGIGEVSCTEAEAIEQETVPDGDGEERMPLGYGLVFGKNERKAIAMAVLDAATRRGAERAEGPAGPAEDEEFVLYHTDGVEIAGFVEHLKLPHYVTFRSSLDRLREARSRAKSEGNGPARVGGTAAAAAEGAKVDD